MVGSAHKEIFRMPSARLSFSFLLCCFFCAFQRSYCDLTAKLLTTNAQEHVAACQECILNFAGAIRAKLVDGNGATESTATSKVAFLVTASNFALMSVQAKCTISDYCGDIEEADISPLHKHLIESNGMPSTKSKAAESTHRIAGEHQMREPLCFLGSHWNLHVLCESCLKEASGSSMLGVYHIAASYLDRQAMVVLYPTIIEKDMFHRCRKCGSSAEAEMKYIPSLICQKLINQSPAVNHNPTIIKHSALQVWYEANIRDESIRDVTSTPRCVGVRAQTGFNIEQCVRSILSGNQGEVTFLYKEGPTQYLHLFSSNVDIEEGEIVQEESMECASINYFEDPETCEKYKSHHFDTSTFTNQLSVWKSEKMMKRPRTVALSYQKRCALAYHQSTSDVCQTCVHKLNHDAVTTRRMTDSTFLVSMSEDFSNDAAQLESCIIESGSRTFREKCAHFDLFPREMCDYETEKNAMVNGYDILEQTHPSHERLAFKLEEGIRPLKKARRSKDKAAGRIEMQPRSMTSNLISNRPNVMVARWTKEDHKCLEYLALNHDVLLLSLENKYVWMLRVQPSLTDIECCGILLNERELYIDVRFLRSVPVNQVRRMLYEHSVSMDRAIIA